VFCLSGMELADGIGLGNLQPDQGYFMLKDVAALFAVLIKL